ncbi:MAG: cadherin repeat domain-containing protein [Candidatus Aminicenantes bacterium]|nr:MAG: cadherin repeat domain-containing protein [Candidatus Aminicenantes bacterium]
MKILQIIVYILLVVSLIGCGGRTEEFEYLDLTGKSSSQGKAGTQGEGEAFRPESPPGGWIRSISFSKHLRKDGTALKIKVETTTPMEEDQHFSYIYWKNGKKQEETSNDTLSPKSYKKGDIIFADVIFYQEGQILEQRRSEMLQITNSSPIIEDVIIPDIEGPGVYHIIVKAHEPDGDKITFSLEDNPLPGRLKINPATGSVTCSLGKKIPPEKMKFIIKADDGDGGITKKAVTITFKIREPENNQEEE